MNKVLVVGGGAAGMMAAIIAAEAGASVVLLERNEKVGRKINITGKGRCNITNNCTKEELLASVPRNPRFLYSAFAKFDTNACMDFFENRGLRLKTERGNRVFPVSDSAYEVTDTLRGALRHAGVKIVHDRAQELLLDEEGTICGVKGEKGEYAANRVLLATGGVSYPATGSTGDGYRMAEAVGHTVVAPKASLISLVCSDRCCEMMQGLSLRNVSITIKNKKKKTVYQDFGEMLFTDKGVSGPMILSASAHLRDYEKDQYRLLIDLKPALDEEKLDARILRDLEEQHNKDFGNVLSGLIPRSMIPVMIERTEIPSNTKANSVTRQQRRKLLETMKRFELNIVGPGPVEQAIITSGGIKTSEINPATMESKKVAGLYFAGELIDVDAYTGGFNLQIAWATGFAAGQAMAGLVAEPKKKKAEKVQAVYSVAIDGPSGAGKSTLARKVAKRLKFVYVDTGAIYRSIGWYVLQKEVSLADAAAIAAVLPSLLLQIEYDGEGLQHMMVNGQDITEEIRLPEISAAASKVAAVPAVRAFLLDRQRDLAKEHSVVMDGRDIGTVVLPDAKCKIFLTASAEVRAQRRCKELEERGTPVAFESVLQDMKKRDEQDRNREIAPLKQAEDAILLDTSDLGFDESADTLEKLIKETLGYGA